ncbi:hypothetical protein Fot_11192 [Forsythia ovata]|uniref:Uncharacterized protein n=1 Tax=Forsythia ovata TaxID=205694 RepID=A0ABD1WJE7_9LAMI
MSVVLEQQQYFKTCVGILKLIYSSSQHMVSGRGAPIYIFKFAVVVAGMLSRWTSPNQPCSYTIQIRSYFMDDQIRSNLKPMTTILPMLLKKINIVIDVLAIERITTTSKQSNS